MWKYNSISEENNENITTSNFVGHHFLPDVNFISGPQLRNLNTDFTLGDCLYRSVKLTKNADLDKCKYTGYGIRFDFHSGFLFTDGRYGKNAIAFGAQISLSVHVDNKGKDILILRKGPTKGLDDTTLTAEAKYPTNFTQSGKRFVLSLHYNESNSFLFANATKVYQFKTKNSEIKYYALCLGNISRDFTINNLEKTGLKEVLFFWNATIYNFENRKIFSKYYG